MFNLCLFYAVGYADNQLKGYYRQLYIQRYFTIKIRILPDRQARIDLYR